MGRPEKAREMEQRLQTLFKCPQLTLKYFYAWWRPKYLWRIQNTERSFHPPSDWQLHWDIQQVENLFWAFCTTSGYRSRPSKLCFLGFCDALTSTAHARARAHTHTHTHTLGVSHSRWEINTHEKLFRNNLQTMFPGVVTANRNTCEMMRRGSRWASHNWVCL